MPRCSPMWTRLKPMIGCWPKGPDGGAVMTCELYHTELVARARQAFGEGRLESAAASITLDNPLCGDRVTLDLAENDGMVRAIRHQVKGCLLCAASAATIAEFGQNRSPSELREMSAAIQALMK